MKKLMMSACAIMSFAIASHAQDVKKTQDATNAQQTAAAQANTAQPTTAQSQTQSTKTMSATDAAKEKAQAQAQGQAAKQPVEATNGQPATTAPAATK